MIGQDNPKYMLAKRFGCYFFSDGKMGEIIAGASLELEQVRHVDAESVCSNAMGWDYFIKQPATVVNLFLYELGGKYEVDYVGWWNWDMTKDEKNSKDGKFWAPTDDWDIAVDRHPWEDIFHFKLENWDPHPGLTLGPRNGRRYFTVRRKS